MADIVDLMSATGARIGEVLALRSADVALVNAEGKVLVRSRIGADVAGFAELVGLIAEHC